MNGHVSVLCEPDKLAMPTPSCHKSTKDQEHKRARALTVLLIVRRIALAILG
jgi:hypothetical protein